MRLSLTSAVLAAYSGTQLVSAAPAPQAATAPKLPNSEFTKFSLVQPISLEEARKGSNPNFEHRFDNTTEPGMSLMATCANVRVRTEWDSYPTADKRAFVDAIKCLMNRGASGQFRQAKSRYEDLVALHQQLTDRVHLNHKFLVWHRYYLWTFEDILRTECGFNKPIPWFDETRYAGKFSQSSVFSGDWFGAIALGGNCVNNGAFAGLTCNVGTGSGNSPHCLARNGDASQTQNCNTAMVDACNGRGTYSDMAWCAERGAHAWGHRGIGSVMADTYASPSDPVFWLHHAFIDRNYRIWQGGDPNRKTSIDGTDIDGNALTLDTGINVMGLRPDIKIRDILDTMNDKLCYKYNY